jgi:hypothetical protein
MNNQNKALVLFAIGDTTGNVEIDNSMIPTATLGETIKKHLCVILEERKLRKLEEFQVESAPDDFQPDLYWFENLSPLKENITVGEIEHPKIIIAIVGKGKKNLNKEIVKAMYSMPKYKEKIEEFIKSNNEMKNNPNYSPITITHSTIGSVTGEGKIDRAITNQYNYSAEEKQTLAEAAKEIQDLLEQISKTYSPPNPSNNLKIATETVEAIEKNPTLKARIISTLKGGATEALKELVDHPAVNIFMALIEGWNSAE